jgi:hypothetical protein
MEKNEMVVACRAYGREERCIQGFGGDIRKTGHLQDPVVDGRILKWIFKKWDGGTDWIDSARKIHTCFIEVVLRVPNTLCSTHASV